MLQTYYAPHSLNLNAKPHAGHTPGRLLVYLSEWVSSLAAIPNTLSCPLLLRKNAMPFSRHVHRVFRSRSRRLLIAGKNALLFVVSEEPSTGHFEPFPPSSLTIVGAPCPSPLQ